MNVSSAVRARKSARAFQTRPVALELLRQLLTSAARAPSGGNLQPWQLHLLTGDALARFRVRMRERFAEAAVETPEYAVYPANLHEPFRSRRFGIGERMYAALGIPREDRAARLAQFARNYDFFGAPVGLFCFIDRRLGPPQWSDLGMYLQTLMLLLEEHGLASCAQESWSTFHQTVREFVGAPDEQLLFCGMAIGYADPTAAVNAVESERAALHEFAVMHTD